MMEAANILRLNREQTRSGTTTFCYELNREQTRMRKDLAALSSESA